MLDLYDLGSFDFCLLAALVLSLDFSDVGTREAVDEGSEDMEPELLLGMCEACITPAPAPATDPVLSLSRLPSVPRRDRTPVHEGDCSDTACFESPLSVSGMESCDRLCGILAGSIIVSMFTNFDILSLYMDEGMEKSMMSGNSEEDVSLSRGVSSSEACYTHYIHLSIHSSHPHLLTPMALHAMMSDVIPRDDACDLMERIHHYEMSQSHGAEESIAPLHAAALIHTVRSAVHVRPYIQPRVLHACMCV